MQKDDGRLEPLEHLHFCVDEELRESFDIFRGDGYPSSQDRAERALVGKKHLQRSNDSVLGDGIGVLVGVGHAGVELEAAVAHRIRPDVVAHLRNLCVRRAHEDPNPRIDRELEHLDDRACLLESNRLSARLLFGHVIDAEELVIAKKHSLHAAPLRTVW